VVDAISELYKWHKVGEGTEGGVGCKQQQSRYSYNKKLHTA